MRELLLLLCGVCALVVWFWPVKKDAEWNPFTSVTFELNQPASDGTVFFHLHPAAMRGVVTLSRMYLTETGIEHRIVGIRTENLKSEVVIKESLERWNPEFGENRLRQKIDEIIEQANNFKEPNHEG